MQLSKYLIRYVNETTLKSSEVSVAVSTYEVYVPHEHINIAIVYLPLRLAIHLRFPVFKLVIFFFNLAVVSCLQFRLRFSVIA